MNKFNVGDRVVRLTNGKNKGGTEGDHYNAYQGLIGTVEVESYPHFNDGRVLVRLISGENAIWTKPDINFIHESVYNSKLYKAIN